MKKEWFKQLTEEQKTKLREVSGGSEELEAVCEQEKLALSDDVLDAVSGGWYVHSCSDDCSARCEW